MATNNGRNEGIRVLEEFVCDAIPEGTNSAATEPEIRAQPHLSALYRDCANRLAPVTQESDLRSFNTPELQCLVWFVLLATAANGKNGSWGRFIQDVFGREAINTSDIYVVVNSLEDNLTDLENMFCEQEHLLATIRKSLRMADQQQLEVAITQELVKNGWDEPRTKVGVHEVLEALKAPDE